MSIVTLLGWCECKAVSVSTSLPDPGSALDPCVLRDLEQPREVAEGWIISVAPPVRQA